MPSRRHLLAMLLALAGCARHASPPAPLRVVRISQRNEPSDLDPARAGLPDDFFVVRALSEGLVVPNPDGGPPLPAAADRWAFSADGLTCTFHLRDGGLWSNGDAVTADDFVASLRRVLTPSTAAPKADLLFDIKNAEAFAAGRLADFGAVGVRAADAQTLVVTLEHPDPEFLKYAASGPWIPVDPRVVADLGRRWTLPGNFVGNGPYTLAEWRPDQRIVVRKNPRYHGAAGIRLDEIQFVRLDDDDSEERAYRANEIDVTMTVPFAKLEADAREFPDQFHRAPVAETRYLAFNTRRRPLNDPRVRRALSLAIDRPQIADDVVRGGREPAWELVPPGLETEERGLENASAKDDLRRAAAHAAPSANVIEAARLLAAAGYPGGRGFPRLELSGWAGTPVLEAVQEMWKEKLGVETAVAVRDARSHVAALSAGNYDIGFITLIPDVADPVSLLERLTTGNPENYPHWSDVRFDALVAAAGRAGDRESRGRFLREAEARIGDRCPLAPVYYNATNWLMRADVRGWRQDALWVRNYDGLRIGDGAP